MTEEYKYSINCGDDVNKLSKAVIYFGLTKLIEDENKCINAISTSRKYFKKHQIEYTLSYGNHIVEYYGSRIFVEYKKYGNPKPNMSCRGDVKYYTEVIIKSNESEEKLKEFLDEAKQYYINTILDKEQEESKISIHMFDDYWDELHKHPKRSIDTIYLNDDLYEISEEECAHSPPLKLKQVSNMTGIAKAVYEYELGISGEKKPRYTEDEYGAYNLNPSPDKLDEVILLMFEICDDVFFKLGSASSVT